jgi:MarR family transcriptional regulator, negative regulator of the multidrug operon emrRAB
MKGIERLAAVESSTPRMARALPQLPQDGTVLVRLLRISLFGMGAFFEPVFRALNLSEYSFHVLCLLVAEERGAASPSELSELVGTTRANMTRILDELVADGYITRKTATRDGRRQVVAISSTGRAKVRDTVPRIANPLKAAFSGLTDQEMQLLDELLRKLIVSFDTNARTVRSAA